MVTVLAEAEIYKKMEFYSFVNWISLVEMFQFHYKQIKHMTIYKNLTMQENSITLNNW